MLLIQRLTVLIVQRALSSVEYTVEHFKILISRAVLWHQNLLKLVYLLLFWLALF